MPIGVVAMAMALCSLMAPSGIAMASICSTMAMVHGVLKIYKKLCKKLYKNTKVFYKKIQKLTTKITRPTCGNFVVIFCKIYHPFYLGIYKN